MGNVINIIRREGGDQALRKADAAKERKEIEDVVSIENRQASSPEVKSVDEARDLLASVVEALKHAPTDLYALDVNRVSVMIS
ncbi:MAG TPA: hypothetical protein PLS81_10520 [Deltaproteobacteria bacterium]|nr:hypothetical protein [Deltaproteobacteria bacterium]HOM29875.1 hypothetical protein [Deltaproteobacteria bacterium]HPP79852.1 hypothetical protein [Deltaproteobacteria bacterium]